MGAGVGHARAATDDCEPGYVDFGNTCSVSSGANSGGKLFGGYQFNRYVAVEGEHARLGTFTENLSGHTCCPVIPAAPKTDTRAYAADLVYGVGIWPITQDFGLLGRFGLGFISGGYAYGSGIGVKYDFHRNVGVRLEYERFSLTGPLNMDWHIDLLTANVIYYFR